MRTTRARLILVSVFLVFFVLMIGAIFVPFQKGEIYSESMLTLLKKLLAVYSVHLAVIFGGIFGQWKSGIDKVPTLPFWIGLVLVFIWNALLAWRFLVFCFSEKDTVGALSAYLDTVVPATSFLVAGALSFFFAKRA
ncbi:MAG TPA: hypothetical protein VJH03_00250 [Blastocatellia bacterium]|nr:hypothetical protein [Blastocatellia bacterium]